MVRQGQDWGCKLGVLMTLPSDLEVPRGEGRIVFCQRSMDRFAEVMETL
jgi:hypothetical protein